MGQKSNKGAVVTTNCDGRLRLRWRYAGRRTIFKSLSITDDIAKTYWIDEKWVEPYAHAETYMDDLKARMLNKLRQNT